MNNITREVFLKPVIEAIQQAEEMGGPDGSEYVELLDAIATEAQRRKAAYLATLPEAEAKAGDDAWYVSQAKAQYEQEGEIEIDSNAIVSRGDDPGAYVQAWVWVGANHWD